MTALGTLSLTALLYRLQDGLCFHCAQLMDAETWIATRPNGWTKEHVIPKAEGGKGLQNNIVLAHRDCNAARGDLCTDADIERTIALYLRAGLRAFTMVGNRPIGTLIRLCRNRVGARLRAAETEFEAADTAFAEIRRERFFEGAEA